MTPRRVIAMVGATGLIVGLIAGPAGIALHHAILPVMGNAAQAGFPRRSATSTFRVKTTTFGVKWCCWH